MGLQRAGHDQAHACAHTHTHTLWFSVTCGWTLTLLYVRGCCGPHCDESWDACILSLVFFSSLDNYPEGDLLDHRKVLFLSF